MPDFTTLIDVDSLMSIMGEAQTLILDCRFDLAAPEAGRSAYVNGHLPGARYVDLNHDLAAPISAHSGRHPLPSTEALAATFASLGVSGDSQVVAYDDGNASIAARLWWTLRWLGHRKVAVLDGGLNAWIRAGGKLERAQDAVGSEGPLECRGSERGGTFNREDAFASKQPFAPAHLRGAIPTAEVDPHGIVSTAELMEVLRDPRHLLVDARASPRFEGTVEPIDTVAGHVPGAVNYPFTRNLKPDGHFLSRSELRRQWLERLQGVAPEDVIMMCGSGVTACHNLLAMQIAGLDGGKLYAGSWSEWIRDEKRGVVVGSASGSLQPPR